MIDVEKKLLAMQAELLIIRRKLEDDFVKEVAINHVIYAIKKALKELAKEEE